MIRIATRDDLPLIAAIGDEYWRTTRMSGKYPFSPEACMKWVSDRFDLDGLLILVSEIEGKIQGALIGCIHAPWCAFAQWEVAQLVMWVMRPLRRGMAEGVRLLQRFEAWAKSKGVVGIGAAHGVFAGGDAERVLTARGYDYMETAVFKEIR